MTGVVLALLILTNTRFGVWLLLDAFGAGDGTEDIFDPRSAPVEIGEFVTADPAFQLPGAIEQPSGISFIEDANRFMIATDQAELFVLDERLSTVQSRKLLSRQLLVSRQGSVEAVTAIDADRAVVAGESSRLELWRWGADDNWYRDAVLEISGYEGEPEFSGVAYNPDSDEYFLATDEEFEVLVLDSSGAVVRTIDIGAGLFVKVGRDLSEYSISGLDFVDGRLYVLTETYNTILVVHPVGVVERVIGVEGGGQLAALTVADGRAYMAVDHNWNEARPPLFVADL
ncbi:MAG TPA: hypothetical protein VIV14_03760 [Gammaproteobacteria bacterium]